jgi:hypothetical protein
LVLVAVRAVVVEAAGAGLEGLGAAVEPDAAFEPPGDLSVSDCPGYMK